MNRTYNTDEFIKLATQVHGDKYDYSKSKCFGSLDKVIIICGKHGEFKQRSSRHLDGVGCRKCGIKLMDWDIFIKRAMRVHKGKYEYFEYNVKNVLEKLLIYCPVHGPFFQEVKGHLNGRGCPKCKFSEGELVIDRILNRHKIEYKFSHSIDGCINILKLRFDFLIEKDEKLYAIEFNGSQHYRCGNNKKEQSKLKDQQIRDKKKLEFCQENNIPLLIIRYDQIDGAEILIKQFLDFGGVK